ncbi:aromatic ring-hydroxylating oxygenase subunit alpha [Oleomonas cavernae]|nr:aromatic ring-hydroxylating dioxygenase subunit alpha [Oleomonas cavernae]
MMKPQWSAPADPFDPAHFAGFRRPVLEADTLPPWCYTSPQFHGREVSEIFGKVWNFIGRTDMLAEPGSYFTLDLVGVPIAVVRGKDGEIRAFANTCRHRGARLLDGEGKANAIRCPYHSWTYDLTGRLRGAAQMEDTVGFAKDDYGLDSFRLATWAGFLFLTFDPEAAPLEDFLGDLPQLLAPYALDDMQTVRIKSWDVACNWKIYVENAMESYHVPTVHAKTIQLQKRDVNPPVFGTGEWCGLYTRHEGSRALEVGDTGFPYIPSLSGPSAEGTYYILIYPSTMLALTFDCMWWLEMYPAGPEKIHLRAGSCFPRSTVAREDFEEVVQRYYRRWDRSIPEDNVISEVQQHGLSSPFARTGRFSNLEPLVHTLGNWVLDRVVRS